MNIESLEYLCFECIHNFEQGVDEYKSKGLKLFAPPTMDPFLDLVRVRLTQQVQRGTPSQIVTTATQWVGTMGNVVIQGDYDAPSRSWVFFLGLSRAGVLYPEQYCQHRIRGIELEGVLQRIIGVFDTLSVTMRSPSAVV